MTYTTKQFSETLLKYKKFRKRLDKKIQTGVFYKLSRKKQNNLINRVKKLFNKLSNLKNALKLATAGATMALALNAGQVNAQKFNKAPFLQKQNKSEIFQKGTFESDLFIQKRGSENPFGGENPFDGEIGAFDNAAFIDIDNDGDLDVFYPHRSYDTNERTIKYLKNEGNNTLSELTEQTGTNNPFDGLLFDTTPYSSFEDIDGDGDLDAFVIDKTNDIIKYFKNIGNNQNPIFEEQIGTENPLDGIDPQNLGNLSFGDIDNDGDSDVFIGTYNEQPQLYRNIGDLNNPIFEAQTSMLFDESTNSFYRYALVDIDNDNDLDFVKQGNDFFENVGNSMNPNFVRVIGEYNPFENIPNEILTLSDIDNDNDYDLIFGDYYGGVKFYRNNGSASNANFEDTDNSLSESYVVFPDFVDIDNDGDYDMFSSAYTPDTEVYRLNYFKNIGTENNCEFEFQEDINNPFIEFEFEASLLMPEFVDIDNDGDFDVFISIYDDSDTLIRYYKNIGTEMIPEFEEQINENYPFNNDIFEDDGIAFIDFIDIDNDGDYDCFLGNPYGGRFIQNTGNIFSPTFDEDSDYIINNASTKYHLIPEFVDIDNDGDYDLFGSSYIEDTERWEVIFYKNVGNSTSPVYEEQEQENNPLNINTIIPLLSFVDIDNDSDKDCFVGSVNKIYYLENNGGVLSSNEINKGQKLSVYPNPVNDIIYFDVANNEKSNIVISDLSGKIVLDINTNNNKIDISHLQGGVYVLKISNSDFAKTTKIIVQ